MTPEPPGKEDIKLVFQQQVGSPSSVELVVIIPTFKRPDHLKTTLQSVISQKLDHSFAVVVMDNHPEGSAGAVAAQQTLSGSGISSCVVLANRRGNCAAYNAGIHTALRSYRNVRWI